MTLLVKIQFHLLLFATVVNNELYCYDVVLISQQDNLYHLSTILCTIATHQVGCYLKLCTVILQRCSGSGFCVTL